MRLSDGAADLVRLLRAAGPLTRAEIGVRTGWARATVNSRLDEVLEHGLVAEAGSENGARGRPAARFEFRSDAGTLLIADVGASAARLAQCDLGGRILAQSQVPLVIGAGPEPVLDAVTEALDALPSRAAAARPWAAAISLPGPVEQPNGRIVSPPIMTGWDGLEVPAVLGPRLGVPLLVENDANAMAWGEHTVSGYADLVLVKVGTGVGAGIVANGSILRGARGAAGDLGHTYAPADEADVPLCRCGKAGCVEAYAGGWAIARDLTTEGLQVDSVGDVTALLTAGEPRAIARVRAAGRVLGASLAQTVSLLNPSEIVVAGQLAVAGEHLLSGIREHVAARSLPLATRSLAIRTSERPNEVGVTGLADQAIRWALEPERLGEVLERAGS